MGAGGLLALLLVGVAARAAAEPRLTAVLTSDERFRGRSVSEGRPTASLDLSLDAASGAYAGLALAGVATRHDGPQLLRAQVYVGLVRPLASGPSLDLGVTHTNYTEYWSGEGAAEYTELYAGLITRRFSSRLYYSPRYVGRGSATLYAELETAARPARNWRLSAHAGVLDYLDGGRAGRSGAEFDWRLGLATALPLADVELAWSGAGPDRDHYAGAPRRRSGVTLALKRTF